MKKQNDMNVAEMSSATADLLFSGGIPREVDTFYEDLAYLRKLSDAITEGLPTLSPDDGMAMASAGWTLRTVEPTEGYPSFDMPAIPGLFK